MPLPTPLQTLHSRSANLSYVAHLKLGKKVSSTHWLTDTDINACLKHELEIDPRTRQVKKNPNVYVKSTMDLDANSIGAALYQVRKDREAAGLHSPYILYVPVNRDGNHFAYIKFEIKDELDDIVVTYKDSLSSPGDKKRKEIEETIKAAIKYKEKVGDQSHVAFPSFTGEVASTINFSAKQRDGWTCGYRTIQEILKELGVNNSLTQVDANKDQNKLRDEVFKSLRESHNLPENTTNFFKQTLKKVFKKEDFKEVNVDTYEKTKPGKVTCKNGDNISVVREEAGVSLSTPSTKRDTLELMVKKMAELAKELDEEDMSVSFQYGDEATKKIIEELCKKYGLKVEESKPFPKAVPLPTANPPLPQLPPDFPMLPGMRR